MRPDHDDALTTRARVMLHRMILGATDPVLGVHTTRARVMLHRMIRGATDPVLGVHVTRTDDAWDVWGPEQCRCRGQVPAYRGLSLADAARTVVRLRPGHRQTQTTEQTEHTRRVVAAAWPDALERTA